MSRPVDYLYLMLPGGLLVGSFAFDAAYLFSSKPGLAAAAFWILSAGIIAEVIEAAFGFLDFCGVPGRPPGKRMGLWRGTGDTFISVLFIWSWLLRGLNQPPPMDAVVLSCLGSILVLLTIWICSPVTVRAHSGAHGHS